MIDQKLNNRFGCWISGGITFDSKFEALTYANQTNNGSISYYYHNHVWQSVDRSLLGKIPLTILYKERAQQLRDTYDYLVLHYSGGSDSHNILHTFLTNNIKLDEVTVRWSKTLRDGKLYTPNNVDTSARNAASEWDYTIKPTLDWLAQAHPNIKINIVDYGSNLSVVKSSKLENTLLKKNPARFAGGTTAMLMDPTVRDHLLSIDKKSIAHIFGIEKPILNHANNTISMQFLDTIFEHTVPIRDAEDGSVVEPFYWTPDMPLLPMEQAYQSALYFKANIKHQQALWTDELRSPTDAGKQFEDQSNVHKAILYKDSWDNRKFQVGKPNLSRSDWYFWIFESPELKTFLKSFENVARDVVNSLDPRMLMKTELTPVFRPVRTMPFPILSLD